MNNKNKLKLLLCVCFFTNIKAPTATVRYMSADESSTFTVDHESGISGLELVRLIEAASEIPFPKLQMRFYLGSEKLQSVRVVPVEAQVTLLRREYKISITPEKVGGIMTGTSMIQHGDLRLRVSGPREFVPSNLEDLSNCKLTQLYLKKVRIVPTSQVKLNQDVVYIAQALCDFFVASGEDNPNTLERYLMLICMLAQEKYESSFYWITKRLFPEADLSESDFLSTAVARDALIEQLQTNFDNPHAENLRQIMQNAGISLI